MVDTNDLEEPLRILHILDLTTSADLSVYLAHNGSITATATGISRLQPMAAWINSGHDIPAEIVREYDISYYMMGRMGYELDELDQWWKRRADG